MEVNLLEQRANRVEIKAAVEWPMNSVILIDLLVVILYKFLRSTQAISP